MRFIVAKKYVCSINIFGWLAEDCGKWNQNNLTIDWAHSTRTTLTLLDSDFFFASCFDFSRVKSQSTIRQRVDNLSQFLLFALVILSTAAEHQILILFNWKLKAILTLCWTSKADTLQLEWISRVKSEIFIVYFLQLTERKKLFNFKFDFLTFLCVFLSAAKGIQCYLWLQTSSDEHTMK